MCSVTSNAALSDISELSAFEVRSIQEAKSKSTFCPRKNPCRELWPICIFLVSSARSTRVRGVKNLPGMHCDHVLLAAVAVTSLFNKLVSFFPLFFST